MNATKVALSTTTTKLKRPWSVGIVGGGIGGLTVANALLRCRPKGFFDVKVYEQASHFIPTAGAAFGFSPNGQVCLASLGIETRSLLHRFDTLVHLDTYSGLPNVESNLFRDIYDRHGFTIGGCLRADLVDLLKESLVKESSGSNSDDDAVFLYSQKLVAMEQDDDAVRLVFEKQQQQANDNNDGGNDVDYKTLSGSTSATCSTHEVSHDIVIGADGIHSTVAQLLQIDDSPPIYSGANIFYGVIENVDHQQQQQQRSQLWTNNNDDDDDNDVPFNVPPPHAVIQGNNVGEFITFGAGPNDRRVQVWAATYPSSEPPPRDEWGVDASSSSDGGCTNHELQTLLSHFPQCHPIHVLAATTTPNRLLHFGLFYRKHKNVWHKRRTCLLGDSCHATLPYVGQGANQAIEDSIVLSNCLTECYYNDDDSSHGGANNTMDSIEAAFESYYRQRSHRTKRIVTMANVMNKLYHVQNPILQRGRDWLLEGFVKGNYMTKLMEREIIDECPVKDYAKYANTNK